jgi:carbon monoxide dehydrogenase subunit G
MELTNEFRVEAAPAEAWEVLTDIERIAPCLPGAELQEIDGDEFRGVVKVKVGPVTAQYKGAARFLERDDDAHRAVLRAEGRETRGQGNASATITAQLTPDGDGTTVSVVTDLTVAGRVAQFGRGILVDVSAKLMAQFADCLAAKIAAGDGDGTAETGASETGGGNSAATGKTGAAAPPSAAPVDLLETAGAPVAKRVVSIGVAVTTFLWLTRLFLRRRRSRRDRRAHAH